MVRESQPVKKSQLRHLHLFPPPPIPCQYNHHPKPHSGYQPTVGDSFPHQF